MTDTPLTEDKSGRCPRCGVDIWRRCIPPYDHTQCSFYKKMLSVQKQESTAEAEEPEILMELALLDPAQFTGTTKSAIVVARYAVSLHERLELQI